LLQLLLQLLLQAPPRRQRPTQRALTRQPQPAPCSSYAEDEKRQFYAEVMGAPDDIHFGLWKDVDENMADAPQRAQINMTNWMWSKARARPSAIRPRAWGLAARR